MSEIHLNEPPQTNVIVLDYDGTLFPKRFFGTESGADPVLVTIIRKLCSEQNFKLVIAAVLQKDEEECRKTLIQAGLNPLWLWNISWRTLDVGFLTGDRYRQIERWYEHYKHLLNKVIIFDDEYCPMTSPISEFWYKCDDENGLTFANLIHLYGTHMPQEP